MWANILAKAVSERPGGAFGGRFFDFNDQVIGSRFFGLDAGGGEVGFLPSFDFGEVSLAIVNVHGDFGIFVIGAEPEPVFVALEELVNDGLGLFRGEIAAPIVFTDGEAFFDIGISGLEGEGEGIVDRRQSRAGSEG